MRELAPGDIVCVRYDGLYVWNSDNVQRRAIDELTTSDLCLLVALSRNSGVVVTSRLKVSFVSAVYLVKQ